MPEGIVAEYGPRHETGAAASNQLRQYQEVHHGPYGNFATGSTQTYVKIQNHPWAMALGGGPVLGFDRIGLTSASQAHAQLGRLWFCRRRRIPCA